MLSFREFIIEDYKTLDEKYLIPAIKQHISHHKKDIEKYSKSPTDKIKAHIMHLGAMSAITVGAGAAAVHIAPEIGVVPAAIGATAGIMHDHITQINKIRKKLKSMDTKNV